MANDRPFVELPAPPRSTTQPLSDADKRGYDFGSALTGDEYAKAIAYRAHIVSISETAYRFAAMLTGSRAAYETLLRKTRALTRTAPSHVEQT